MLRSTHDREVFAVDQESSFHHFIRILQNAYSGELAAGYAYRGHWKSVSDPSERSRIQQIENEEWVHRQRVGKMLLELSAQPQRHKEIRMWITGRVIGLACHFIGWFLPMYFAGRLESGNVVEYELAASHARALGLFKFETDLLRMASVEKEHELYFLSVVSHHPLLPRVSSIFHWGKTEPAAVESGDSEMPALDKVLTDENEAETASLEAGR